jgi:hypothetical protein
LVWFDDDIVKPPDECGVWSAECGIRIGGRGKDGDLNHEDTKTRRAPRKVQMLIVPTGNRGYWRWRIVESAAMAEAAGMDTFVQYPVADVKR